jgi:hypothetical protein
MPDKKLGGEKWPRKKTIVPPKSVDNMPKYDPSTTPITGAVIDAMVMAKPGKPIIGEIGQSPKIAYNAAKHIIKEISLVLSVRLSYICAVLLTCCGNLIIRHYL